MASEPNHDNAMDRLEGEVSELLKEAESLASELTHEVGATDDPPSTRESEFFESETDSEASLDVAMEQASAAAEAASEEAGIAPPDSDAAPPPTAPKKKISLPPRKTQTAPADESQPPSRSAAVKQPQPAATPGVRKPTARAPQPAPARGAGTDTFDDLSGNEVSGLVAARVDAPPFELDAPAPRRAAALFQSLGLSRLAAMKEPAIDHVCTALEIVDRPFAKINGSVRKWLGVAAVLLIVGALSLLVFVVL